MTTGTDHIEQIFQDARELQASAVERLDHGDLQADALEMLAQGGVRDALEKSWGAAKRATDALVLARPVRSPSVLRRREPPSGC